MYSLIILYSFGENFPANVSHLATIFVTNFDIYFCKYTHYVKTKLQVKTLDLGTRKVSNMNFSKVVTLPKPFTQNYLGKNMKVAMSMSQNGQLTLTPITESEEVKKNR